MGSKSLQLFLGWARTGVSIRFGRAFLHRAGPLHLLLDRIGVNCKFLGITIAPEPVQCTLHPKINQLIIIRKNSNLAYKALNYYIIYTSVI